MKAELGCAGCDDWVTVTTETERCPKCGALLWEDEELPAPVEKFVNDL